MPAGQPIRCARTGLPDIMSVSAVSSPRRYAPFKAGMNLEAGLEKIKYAVYRSRFLNAGLDGIFKEES
jgi:hypothetical protein